MTDQAVGGSAASDAGGAGGADAGRGKTTKTSKTGKTGKTGSGKGAKGGGKRPRAAKKAVGAAEPAGEDVGTAVAGGVDVTGSDGAAAGPPVPVGAGPGSSPAAEEPVATTTTDAAAGLCPQSPDGLEFARRGSASAGELPGLAAGGRPQSPDGLEIACPGSASAQELSPEVVPSDAVPGRALPTGSGTMPGTGSVAGAGGRGTLTPESGSPSGGGEEGFRTRDGDASGAVQAGALPPAGHAGRGFDGMAYVAPEAPAGGEGGLSPASGDPGDHRIDSGLDAPPGPPSAGDAATAFFGRARESAGDAATAFFGRAREIKALHEDIERAGLNTISGRKEPRARVLLIAGRPGSGRTALAHEIVRRLADRYPDGVVRARLTETGGDAIPPAATAREILTAFGIAGPPGAGEDQLSEMVREALAVRRVLLLLDDAVDAEQVDPLVPDNPDCLVVAVAQGPLTGIPDVRPCTLGGMDVKAAVDLLARYTGAVRITVDPQAAEALVEECGGQPAALVLAGGWLAARPTASVADVAAQLRALPDDPGMPVGDRPLARVFGLVYATLAPSTARTLRLLALAPTGLTDAHTTSALAGCSVTDARTTLDGFVAVGMLRHAGDPRGELYEVPACLVPLLRALLAQDRPGELRLARARMLERTVRLLQSCRAVTEPEGSAARRKLSELPRALRFPDAAAADDWLRTRLPALIASARLAVADGELDTLARRLVAALVRALAAHRGTEDAAPELYGLHHLVLDIARRRGLHREQAAALLNIGDLDARTGRTHDALARYRAALDAGRAANDHYATGRAMESVGGAHQDLEDWQRAADWYGRALAQRIGRGERADEARLYGRLGAVHTYAGRYGEALRDWRAAAAGHRRLGDLTGQARALGEAARVEEYAGHPYDSLRTCEEAVGWARLAGDVRLEAALRIRLADTLDRVGDPTAARLHRAVADRLLGTEEGDSAYEIRSTSAQE